MTNGWGTNQGGPLPPQQPGPAGQVQFDEPDWAALADQHQREQSRRKRMKAAGGVLAAVVAVGGITAVATATSSPGRPKADPTVVVEATAAVPQQPDTGGDPSPAVPPSDSPSPSASPSGSPSPSTSPSRGAGKSPGKGPGKAPSSAPASPAGPPDPLTVISSAATDTAPLTPAGVLPAATMQVNGKTWTRLTESQTATCYQATTGGLGNVLAAQGCRSMIRVTYTSGNSAVTIGIAVLDSKAEADAVTAAFQGQVQGLVPSGHTSYCTSTGCQGTHASVGRYVYLTVSGTVKPGGTAADATATAAGPAFAATARAQLLARGSAH
ncbi:hypothetical protein ACFC6L_05030 [Kitasatospora phosalacinea]|uniref:hypothetical protein n=1 Tax=Kitasatospora phosalacinea TaxID=2065 RepID=UPI0035D7F1E0